MHKMMQVPKGFIKKHMKSGFECLISCAFVILGCSTVIYETMYFFYATGF